MTTEPEDLPCSAFVELVTEYLDGALTRDETARLEAHLAVCPGCLSVLEQLRAVIALTGRLRDEDVERLPAVDREPLLRAFRQWAGSRGAR
jgi:anti-sigma factor RsiW